MKFLERARRYLSGSIDDREDFVHLGIGATFPADSRLEQRVKEASSKLPPNSVKRLIQEPAYRECTKWSWDANGSPIDDYYGPIG